MNQSYIQKVKEKKSTISFFKKHVFESIYE